uniref:Uncharacterized protein n=1 Tax=Romanomermis culicivorax TaxID=13658 RepID=A0A915JAV1_ROMCU
MINPHALRQEKEKLRGGRRRVAKIVAAGETHNYYTFTFFATVVETTERLPEFVAARTGDHSADARARPVEVTIRLHET